MHRGVGQPTRTNSATSLRGGVDPAQPISQAHIGDRTALRNTASATVWTRFDETIAIAAARMRALACKVAEQERIVRMILSTFPPTMHISGQAGVAEDRA